MPLLSAKKKDGLTTISYPFKAELPNEREDLVCLNVDMRRGSVTLMMVVLGQIKT